MKMNFDFTRTKKKLTKMEQVDIVPVIKSESIQYQLPNSNFVLPEITTSNLSLEDQLIYRICLQTIFLPDVPSNIIAPYLQNNCESLRNAFGARLEQHSELYIRALEKNRLVLTEIGQREEAITLPEFYFNKEYFSQIKDEKKRLAEYEKWKQEQKESLDQIHLSVQQFIGFNGCLDVTVKQGRNLSIKDKSTKSSDPYCVVRLNKTRFKTAIRKKNLNPTWDQNFKFKCTKQEHNSKVKFHLWDHDLTGKDCMGVIFFDMSS
eukprot:TRINITY_DN1104_c1_g2_i2.p1 TRINITY_DN1104_c1_g2~~TRINITY_DN1104_c1_g2_i2.p1  ORF type:complete len:274 (-),score=79.77 TRINITY_DN1104_c1_g2_i2:38-826(-)